MHINLDWAPYFAIADSDRSQREKLAAYGELARDEGERDVLEEVGRRTLELCERCMGEAAVSPRAIDEVLLVGGQSRQQLHTIVCGRRFGGTELMHHALGIQKAYSPPTGTGIPEA